MMMIWLYMWVKCGSAKKFYLRCGLIILSVLWIFCCSLFEIKCPHLNIKSLISFIHATVYLNWTWPTKPPPKPRPKRHSANGTSRRHQKIFFIFWFTLWPVLTTSTNVAHASLIFFDIETYIAFVDFTKGKGSMKRFDALITFTQKWHKYTQIRKLCKPNWNPESRKVRTENIRKVSSWSTDEKLFAAWADSLISDKKLANANSRSNAWSIKTDIKTRFQLE